MSLAISSPFGYRVNPVTKLPQLHTGIDLPAPEGTPVVAARGGTVERVDRAGVGRGIVNGNAVIVKGAAGMRWAYLHLSRVAVAVGQMVAAGQILGAVGRTGRTTGAHLHLQVEVNGTPVDPVRCFPSGTFRRPG